MALKLLSRQGKNYIISTFVRRFSSAINVAENESNAISEFPGVRANYTNELKFVSDKSYETIPVYRVLDSFGKLLKPNDEPNLEKETLLHMYKTMVQLEQLDKVLYESQRQGRISFYMTNYGEEGIHVGSASALPFQDIMYFQYREAGVMMYRGFTVRQMIDQCFGNVNDISKGRHMPVHYGSKELNCITISSPLTTQLPQAVGTAYALKRTPNNERCCICYFGEGAASEGDAHAAFNFAAILDCPIIFICRNNGYAISTPSSEQYRGDGIAGRAAGYGINVLRVDGTDALAVHNAVKKAREYASTNNKPVLVEAMNYRVGHHSTSDDSSAYRSLEEIEIWKEKMNPILKLKAYLTDKGYWSAEEEKTTINEARKNVLSNMREAEKLKKPHWGELFEDVYYVMPPNLQNQRKEMEEHVKKYKEHYPLREYESET